MKHKHHEIINAWADGAKIEYRDSPRDNWLSAHFPKWNKDTEYRVVKPNISKWLWADPEGFINPMFMTDEEAQNRNCNYGYRLTVKLYFSETLFLSEGK